MMKRTFAALALATIAFMASDAAFAADVAADAAPWWQAAWDYVRTPAAVGWFIGLLTALAPQGNEGSAWWIVRKLLDLAANNWGNAKNAPK